MDERDQDVQRAPLWPPDPEPGSETPQPPTPEQEPEQAENWAANWAEDPPLASSDIAPPYQPDLPPPETPTATPATEQPQPWDEAGATWEAPQYEPQPPAAAQPPEAPQYEPQPPAAQPQYEPQPPAAQPPEATQYEAQPPAAPQTVSDAPTTHISAAPAPTPAPTPTPARPVAPTPLLAPADELTQQYAGPPLAPPVIPPIQVRSARKRSAPPWRLGVTLLISALLLAAALGLYSHAATLAAEPQRLMTNYCAALARNDYPAAYSMLSASAQAQQPEAQYLADAAARDTIQGRITACSAKPAQALSALEFLREPNSMIFNAQITRKEAASGQIALTRDAKGWHVAALSSPLHGIDLGPLAAQQALCKAFNTRDYSQAYALLSTPYQQEQGNATTFARSFGDTLTVTACAANLKTYSVNSADQQATFDVTLTLSFVGATTGSPPTAFTLPTKFTFVREATGWRVDDIKPLLAQ